jgi:hypothetical protein
VPRRPGGVSWNQVIKAMLLRNISPGNQTESTSRWPLSSIAIEDSGLDGACADVRARHPIRPSTDLMPIESGKTLLERSLGVMPR